jgi:tripartite-type tricarboxylate transporter receptor subunit TctC
MNREDALRSLPRYNSWLVACLVVMACGLGSALAENWPTRPVTLVVPFGAGSGSDVVARILTAKISDSLGQQMIVEDLGGAGGTIAVSRVAKAPPDGYQIALGAVDTFAQSQYLFKEPTSNTLTDFTPIGLAIEQPLLLVVRNDLPVSNLKEFAAYLKANQAKMRFGSAGVGAAPYLACSMLTASIGATATHVPYRSAAPALQDMIRGDIDYYCPLSISVSGLLESKSVRALAVLTRDRSPLYPDLPTAREQGFDVVDGYYWMGLFAPKDTSASIVATLNEVLGKTLADPTVQARLRDASATVVAPDRRSSAYLKKYLGDEITKWAGIMKASNVPQQ